MVTLSLDTSHPVGSVALARDGQLLGSETFREPATHLVSLGHSVDRLLASTALTPAGIDRLAVVTGPGSFTGLRIGLSFAKGLYAARNIPMVTINALQLLALPWLSPGARVCAMIDARRGEVYAALYERASNESLAKDASAAHEVVAPAALTPAKWLASLPAQPEVFVGTGAFAHRDMLRAQCPGAMLVEGAGMYPSTSHLASIAHHMQPLDESVVRSLEPFYLRASGAEQVKLRAHAQNREGMDG
jgi:tRNA threonylcarbamoyladenosine biosynthesis protein TsaB